MTSTDEAWREWGRKDPYFGVLTEDRYRGGERKDEFFESGKVLVEECLARLESRFGPIARKRAVDFGSGVGRLSLALADHFDEVVGIDISPDMIKVAEANSLGRAVTYALSDDELSNVSGKFDLAFSYIVLQHVPVERGLSVIDQLITRSDAFILHFPFDRPALSTVRGRIAASLRKTALGDRFMRKLKGQPALGGPPMQMNVYPIPAILSLAEKHGFDEVLVSRDDQGSTKCLVLSAVKRSR